MKTKPLLILLFIIIPTLFYAQTGTIRGSIIDKNTGQAILYATIFLKGTNYGAVSDNNGYFTISKIPLGKYKLTATYIGYDTLSFPVEISDESIITKKLFLVKGVYEISGATISAERQARQSDPTTSLIKVNSKTMNRLPTIGGQADIAQYLQVVPGVIFSGDQGGQLYIRGGTPVQNLVLLDGMTIYNPFHSIGLFSVFDADIISNTDIYTGGFGAEYGGRISSVMDVTTRYGNTMRFGGKLDVNTFGSKILLEGPLLKAKTPGSGSISYILSFKKSYIDKTSKTLYNYVNEGNGLPFSFTDLYGKLSLNGENGNRADFFGFNFNDKVNYQTISNYEWHSSGAGMKFTVIPDQSPMLLTGKLSYSNYKMQLNDGLNIPRSSEVGGFNMGLDFTYFMGKNKLTYGVEMNGFKTDLSFVNSVNRVISQKESTTEIAGFVSTKLLLGNKITKKGKEEISKFIIVPGLRIHYYASLANLSIEPRFAAKYNVSSTFRIKGATGLYSQNIISTASDRDVVNLFYGFVSGPDNLQKKFDGKTVTTKLQKSTHLIFGVEKDITPNLTLNIEAYYKWFTQLTNINKTKIYDDNNEYLDKPDSLKKDFILEKGDAEGIDLSLKYNRKQLYISIIYSLAYNHRFDGNSTYIPHFDRRNNANFLATYSFGPKKLWDINLRWNYGSGFPFTPTAGNYEILNFQTGMQTDYTTANGNIGFIYGALNSERLPDYHRMDIGIKKKFVFTETSILEIAFSITNVYNRSNIFYFDRITNKRVDQLPFMPSLGMNFSF